MAASLKNVFDFKKEYLLLDVSYQKIKKKIREEESSEAHVLNKYLNE